MALSRGRLTNQVVNVSTGTTVGIVTVANSKRIYVKSIVAHNTSGVTTARAHVYYVPNGSSITDNTKIFNIAVDPFETVLIEPSYPIILTTTGDNISIGSSFNQINIIINGDQEV